MVSRQIEKEGGSSVCPSIIVAAEIKYGVARSGSKQLAIRVDAALCATEVLPFDIPADKEYEKVRAALDQKGELIGPNDLLIAAHAFSLGLTLATENV